MFRWKIKILLGVAFVTAAVIVCGMLISITSGLEFAYRPKQALQSPIIREYWVFIIFLISIEFFCIIYAMHAWRLPNNTAPFVLMMVATVMTLPVFFIGAQYSTNVPFSFKMDREYYVVSWNFQPDANNRNGGSYLRVHATYPGFQALLPDAQTKTQTGFRVRASRQTSPDMLCFGLIGCLSEVGVPRSKLPVSQQFISLVKEYVNVIGDILDFQEAWLIDPEKRTQYFYKKNINSAHDTYGICQRSPLFVDCDYLFSEGRFFYNINIVSNDLQSVSDWKIDRDIPLVSAGVVKLFDSFQN